jgi:hypothetical protein
MQTFIYFLGAGEFVKIGQSKRWQKRVDSLQTGAPITYQTLLVIPEEVGAERALHDQFKADHFRGEWFHLSPAILSYIEQNLSRCVARTASDPPVQISFATRPSVRKRMFQVARDHDVTSTALILSALREKYPTLGIEDADLKDKRAAKR